MQIRVPASRVRTTMTSAAPPSVDRARQRLAATLRRLDGSKELVLALAERRTVR